MTDTEAAWLSKLKEQAKARGEFIEPIGRAKENVAPAVEQTKHKYWLWIGGGLLALVAISNCSGNTKNQTHYTKGEPYYTSRDGNRIAIPGQSSEGATARCRDGSWSHSENRRGTCSQEGGVKEWLR